MAEVKWIKIVTDIFDDEKIMLIEGMPSADSILVIWFKLLCLAGKHNNDGVFMLNDKIAYTDEMLATIFRRDKNTVRYALKTLEEFGMIDIVEGVVTIPNWSKHQNLEKVKARQEYMRLYMQEKRAKQKAICCGSLGNEANNDNAVNIPVNVNSDANVNNSVNINNTANVNIPVNVNNDVNEMLRKQGCKQDVSALDNKDNKDINILKDDDDMSNNKMFDEEKESNKIFDHIKDSWNTLKAYGITPIKTISSSKKRATLVRARINQYGESAFDEAIEQIKVSDFLQGRHSGQAWQVTFDWLIKPSNFPKVLEGTYKNFEEQQPPRQELQPQRSTRVRNFADIGNSLTPEEIRELEAQLLEN